MTKLLNILQSPFLIALILAIVIIRFIPDKFNKYKTELVDSKVTYLPQSGDLPNIYFYNDLDNDGKSEKIIAGGWSMYDALHNNISFVFRNNNDGIIDVENFTGFSKNLEHLCFGDYDNDGHNEIYFIYRKKILSFFSECIL